MSIGADLCLEVIEYLIKVDCDDPIFGAPVDAKAYGPDMEKAYNSAVSRPMDLGTVRSRLVTGTYTTIEDFATDVRQVWHNATCFNSAGNPINAKAREYSVIFEAAMKKVHTILEHQRQQEEELSLRALGVPLPRSREYYEASEGIEQTARFGRP
ncbi:MAG: hypothetical protein MHM6MM_000776 [Cercozoa sp. M6MM]